MPHITSPENALEDLKAFVEDVQAEPPRDFDSLQIIMREQHSVSAALALLAITNRIGGYANSYQTIDRASFKCQLPGSGRTRNLSITNIAYGDLASDIVEVKARRTRGLFGAGQHPTERLELHFTPEPSLFDAAVVGWDVYRPASARVAEQFRKYGDEEFQKAREGAGDYNAAINAHLAAVRPEEQAPGSILNFVNTATRLIIGVTNAFE